MDNKIPIYSMETVLIWNDETKSSGVITKKNQLYSDVVFPYNNKDADLI